MKGCHHQLSICCSLSNIIKTEAKITDLDWLPKCTPPECCHVHQDQLVNSCISKVSNYIVLQFHHDPSYIIYKIIHNNRIDMAINGDQLEVRIIFYSFCL